MIKGIDVSDWQGKIDWNEAKNDIDFAMLRAGLGNDSTDLYIDENIRGCEANNIPYGLYWFSYAVTPEQARLEADFLCDIADEANPTFPLAFDFEEDSDRYAKSLGYNLTNSDRYKIAMAFLNRVKERGYKPILYSNPDYIMNKGFDGVAKVFPIWLAHWGVGQPSYACDIWQYGQAAISGINGNVDMNICYNTSYMSDFANEMISYFDSEQLIYYIAKAGQVIKGVYGDGNVRKKAIRAEGYDYEIIQYIVNQIMSLTDDINEYILNNQVNNYEKQTEEYKKGSYGKDKQAKKLLNDKGYDFEIIRHMADYI